MSKIRSEREMTSDTTKSTKVYKKIHKILYSKKLNDLEGMNKFPKAYNLPRMVLEAGGVQGVGCQKMVFLFVCLFRFVFKDGRK